MRFLPKNKGNSVPTILLWEGIRYLSVIKDLGLHSVMELRMPDYLDESLWASDLAHYSLPTDSTERYTLV